MMLKTRRASGIKSSRGICWAVGRDLPGYIAANGLTAPNVMVPVPSGRSWTVMLVSVLVVTKSKKRQTSNHGCLARYLLAPFGAIYPVSSIVVVEIFVVVALYNEHRGSLSSKSQKGVEPARVKFVARSSELRGGSVSLLEWLLHIHYVFKGPA